ncbi:GNAT family N-acetyltransferase [soil metagenome]
MVRKVAENENQVFCDDLEAVCEMIHELAGVEGRPDDARPNPEALAAALKGKSCRIFAYVAENPDGKRIGYALLYLTFSSFKTSFRLHLEDLYIREASRGQGVGTAFMVAAAKLADELGATSLEWAVRRDNDAARHYYDQYGPTEMDGWRHFSLEAAQIKRLAQNAVD